MRKRILGVLLGAAAVLTAADTASAIRWGEPDGGEHPYVGLMVAFVDGAPAWRCSGTMISDTYFLTAGHCTYGADHVEVWFGEDLTDAAANNYPFEGDVGGTPYTHPQYNDAAFYLHDVGVVVLDSAPGVGSATLAAEGALDTALATRGNDRPRFEVVGYGLQKNSPVAAQVQADRVRLKATVRLINDNRLFGGNATPDGTYVVFSNNANTGGTCNGDSGGPSFFNNTSVIAAVTSFGVNQNCAGTGGGYRIDQADDLAFIWNPTSGTTGSG